MLYSIPLTNSSSKNSSVEVEFYRKKIINQHFFSRKSQKAIRKEMHIFETRNLKKICEKKSNNCKKQLFDYKTKDIDCE